MGTKELIDTNETLNGTIAPEKIIDVLRETLVKFELSSSIEKQKEVMSDFYKKVDDWEVILINPAKHKIWLQGPIRFFERKNRYSRLDRIKAFLSKGLILKEKEIFRYADITSNIKFPVELTLSPVHSFSANSSEENKFYYTVFSVLKSIEYILDRVENNLAVYKKPAGIVAMNTTVFNLKEISRLTGAQLSALTNSIETIPFAKLISDSEVGVVTNLGFESYKDLMKNTSDVQTKVNWDFNWQKVKCQLFKNK